VEWLRQNYQWVFSGFGVVLVLAIIKLFRRRSGPSSTSSTVVGPSGNQNVVAPVFNNVVSLAQPISAAPPLNAAPAGNTPRPLPNILCTDAYVGRLWEKSETVVSDGIPPHGKEPVTALIVQFTNEARKGEENVGGYVKAHLIYRDAEGDRLRIKGTWLNESDDVAKFEVDDSHRIAVGFIDEGEIATVSKQHAPNTTFVPIEYKHIHDFEEGSVDIRLTHADSGKVLFEGRFLLKTKPPRITYETPDSRGTQDYVKDFTG
jgi:hypothetical protein